MQKELQKRTEHPKTENEPQVRRKPSKTEKELQKRTEHPKTENGPQVRRKPSKTEKRPKERKRSGSQKGACVTIPREFSIGANPRTTVHGVIDNGAVRCRVERVDTLRQIVHRVARRFPFIRWGTKAIRQKLVCFNPHTRIRYTEYIELKSRRKRQ